MVRRNRIKYTPEQKTEIWDGWKRGETMHDIGREIARNGGRKSYRATTADKRALDKALRPKPCKLVLNGRLRQAVIIKLKRYWSPQQIAGWLKRKYSGNEAMHVSRETLYLSLYVQTRGALKKELIQYLRGRRTIRQSRYGKPDTDKRGKIPDAVPISERPVSVEDRAVPGHWEGDLICGPNIHSVVMLVERHSRYVMLIKVPQARLNKIARELNERPRKTLDYECPAERLNACVAATH